MKWTWQSTPPAVRMRPSPARISVDGPIRSAGWTPSAMSGLPALPSATIRPSRTPTSHFTTPQWSSTTAFVITRSGAPSARVVVPCSIDSRIVLPPPNTASSPPTQSSRSTSIQRSVSASRTWSPTVGPYELRVAVAADPHSVPSRRSPGTRRAPASATSSTSIDDAGLEPHRRARPARRAGTRAPRRGRSRAPGSSARSGRATRPGSAGRRCSRRAAPRARGPRSARARPRPRGSRPGSLDRLVEGHELAPVGEGRLDLHLVDELGHALHHVVAGRAPRGPACISCSTVRSPSRAASSTQHESSATASGSFSLTPARAPLARDHPGDREQQLLLLRTGDRRIARVRSYHRCARAANADCCSASAARLRFRFRSSHEKERDGAESRAKLPPGLQPGPTPA